MLRTAGAQIDTSAREKVCVRGEWRSLGSQDPPTAILGEPQGRGTSIRGFSPGFFRMAGLREAGNPATRFFPDLLFRSSRGDCYHGMATEACDLRVRSAPASLAGQMKQPDRGRLSALTVSPGRFVALQACLP